MKKSRILSGLVSLCLAATAMTCFASAADATTDAKLKAYFTEEGLLAIEIDDNAVYDNVYGLQFKVTFTGATYEGEAPTAAELPSGWNVVFTDKEKVTDSVVACLDCNFKEALGADADNAIAYIQFSNVSDPTFTVSDITAVTGKDGSGKEVIADVTAEKVTSTTTTTTTTVAATTTTTAAATTTTTAAAKTTTTAAAKTATNNPSTGVAGLAAVAGVASIALAATVVTKKRG